MKPPATLTVGPYTYRIESRELDDEAQDGMTDHPKGVVTIRPGMGTDYAAETLMHESLHCVWHLAGINKKINEEHVVSRLATHLLDLIRRNPKLVAYLVAK